ncbi:MAG: hypothetical protein ACYCV6_09500 [Steroidobacteraceae bacterium]
MKLFRDRLLAGLSLATLVFGSPAALAVTVSAGAPDGTPHLLTELLFNATTPMETTLEATSTTAKTLVSLPSTLLNNTPGWSIGAQNGGAVGVQATTGPTGSTVDALVGDYPLPGTGADYIWANYSVASLNTEDVYIEFWARMPAAKEGCKFVKIFGQNLVQGSYANTTIATNYTGVDYGALWQVAFGDGTSVANDDQNVINLNGTNPQWIGRSYGTAVVQTPQDSLFSSADWGAGWHHFLIHVKFNSGTTAQNEVPNGEYFLEVDGKVYVDATGLYNRNPADGPIDHIGFFGWAQGDPSAFQLDYYDIRISTGGFMDTPLPDPPSNVAVQ